MTEAMQRAGVLVRAGWRKRNELASEQRDQPNSEHCVECCRFGEDRRLTPVKGCKGSGQGKVCPALTRVVPRELNLSSLAVIRWGWEVFLIPGARRTFGGKTGGSVRVSLPEFDIRRKNLSRATDQGGAYV